MLMERKPPPTSRPLGHYIECTPEQIETALSIQSTVPEEEDHRRLGELLLETGASSLEEVLNANQAKVLDVTGDDINMSAASSMATSMRWPLPVSVRW